MEKADAKKMDKDGIVADPASRRQPGQLDGVRRSRCGRTSTRSRRSRPSVEDQRRGACATVEVKMPDNLTRYRIVAIATAGTKQFGKGESA
jgi:hypothetical protein